VPNVSPNTNSPFEDWWVRPELVQKSTIATLKSLDKNIVNPIESYFLNN